MSAGSLEFLIPGDLQAATGGYGYDRRMIAGLRALGWQVTVHALDPSFPQPTVAAIVHAQAVCGKLPDQALVLMDGLAAGAMPQIVRAHASRLRLLALVHHPLGAETGLAHDRAVKLRQSERLALSAVRHVLVTSRATKQTLQSYGVEFERVSVVEPGTDPAAQTRHARGEILHLLCVATLIPRKGHDVLFAALAPLASLRWQLTCVGSPSRSPATARQLRDQLQHLGLEERVTLAGEVDAATLALLYADADLFVLPTRLEGYGMAVAEALAHGLPLISTPVGAIPELVGTQAGLLVPPGDTAALSTALARVMNERALLDGLAAGAAALRRSLPDWPQACAEMSRVLQRL